jgi:hypothetical protein
MLLSKIKEIKNGRVIVKDETPIFGRSWEQIQAMQNKTYKPELIKTIPGKDYGADPLGNGKFKMVPSGDIVDLEERNRRLKK